VPSAIERRLFAGAFQPDLENALASAVEAHRQERGPLAPAVLLVGSNLLGIYLTRLLARRLGAVGGLRVVTFLDLARALTRAEIDREGLRAIPEGGERLLASTLAAALPHTSYFANIARTQGFEEAILATLRDLRDAGFAPRDLRRCFPRGHRKIQDLATLLENYDETLQSARLIDRSGLLARARAMVEQDAAGTSETSRLFVYGFYDFTWLQESLLLHLARFLPTTIFFPWRETPAFEFARSTFARLRDAGFAPPPGPPPAGTESFRAARGVGRSLTRVQEFLFLPPGRDHGEPSEGGEPATVDSSLRMVAAPGEAREVLEAVRAIAGLARQGVPLEEIGILYRSGDPYARLVASQLADLGIRSFSLEGRALAQTRTARALFALLNIRERDHERAAVIGFLAIADLDPGIVRDVSEPAVDRAPISPPNPADWDLLSRMAGIVSGREEWGERLDRLARALVSREAEARAELNPEAGPPPDPRFIEECRRLRRLHARLAKALDRLPDEASWSTMSETVDGLARRFLAPHEERESILEVVGDLAALEAISPRTTLADFVRLLSRELESRGPAEGHFQRGHLFVGDVQTARGLGFRALIVLGLTEQSFPARIRQDPVLLDAERQALNRSAGDGRRLPLKAERLKEERILFALAAGAARLDVWIEEGPYAILACVIRGIAPRELRDRMAEVLENVHREYSGQLDQFDGETAPFTKVAEELSRCLEHRYRQEEKTKSFGFVYVTAAIVFLLVAGWLGWRAVQYGRWDRLVNTLREQPGFVITSFGREHGKFAVRGLRDPLAADPAQTIHGSNVDPADGEFHWGGYYSLDDGIVEQRAKSILSPPATAILKLKSGVLVVTGAASASWVKDIQSKALLVPGIHSVELSPELNPGRLAFNQAKAQIESSVVKFQVATAALSPAERLALRNLVASIQSLLQAADSLHQSVTLEVLGHTDSTGAEVANLDLSQRRADRIAWELGQLGVPERALRARGVGTTNPLRTEENEDNRQFNRSGTFRVSAPAP